MLQRIRKSLEQREEGFTLIELLVVIIIIGILAAIAIPVFLNQRKKAWDSAAKSDVKNMSTAEETHLTDNDVYTASVPDLVTAGFRRSEGVEHGACANTGLSYVVVAKHTDSTNYHYFDSATGQLETSAALPTIAADGVSCDVTALSATS